MTDQPPHPREPFAWLTPTDQAHLAATTVPTRWGSLRLTRLDESGFLLLLTTLGTKCCQDGEVRATPAAGPRPSVCGWPV